MSNQIPAQPNPFERKLTINDFTVTNQITACSLTVVDQIHYQRMNSSLSSKFFPWAMKIDLAKTTRATGLPINIDSLIKRIDAAGQSTTVPKLFQDILLSYFGNHTKDALIACNWNPTSLLSHNKNLDPMVEIRKVISNSMWEQLTTPFNPNTGDTLTLKEYLVYFLDDYGCVSRQCFAIWALMYENKIPFPFDLPNKYKESLSSYIHFDEETRLIINPRAPAPVKPVEVEPAPEKKDEQNPAPSNQSPASEPAPVEQATAVEPLSPAPVAEAVGEAFSETFPGLLANAEQELRSLANEGLDLNDDVTINHPLEHFGSWDDPASILAAMAACNNSDNLSYRNAYNQFVDILNYRWRTHGDLRNAPVRVAVEQQLPS